MKQRKLMAEILATSTMEIILLNSEFNSTQSNGSTTKTIETKVCSIFIQSQCGKHHLQTYMKMTQLLYLIVPVV